MNPGKSLTYFGAGIFALIAAMRIAALARGEWFVLPLLIQAVMACYLLLRRNDVVTEARLTRRVIAWMLTILPLVLDISQHNLAMDILSFFGVCVNIWALGTLGKSFGIAPANRGLVVSGPYKFIRHPMYLGEAISYGAILIGNFTLTNICFFSIFAVGMLLRIWFEEQVISGYENYSNSVRYRLIPYVW